MNSRRKFLIRGSMVSTAFLAAKPFKTFAKAAAPLSGAASNANKLALFHTGNFSNETLQQIAAIKNTNANVVLLNAGKEASGNQAQLSFDASINQSNPISATANNYKIIYKGDFKIGVISAIAGTSGVIDQINELSTYLKNKLDCHLVVCLSQLGYKNKHGVDDVSLAAGSTSLDLIIGGDEKNYSKDPVIVLSKLKAEVIIHHSAESSFELGKIEIAFDAWGKKRNIAFNNNSRQKLTA